MNLIDAQVKEVISKVPFTNNKNEEFNIITVRYVDDGGQGKTELIRPKGVEVKVGDIFQH